MYIYVRYICKIYVYIYILSHILYICSIILLYSVFFFCIQSHILSQTLSCSRFTNNQIELRKRQVQKYRKQNIE